MPSRAVPTEMYKTIKENAGRRWEGGREREGVRKGEEGEGEGEG